MENAYPMHVVEIHKLRGLSMDGKYASQGFQGSWKHNQKKGKLNLYDKYGTRCIGHWELIEPINDEKVHYSFYLIVGKVMKNYS